MARKLWLCVGCFALSASMVVAGGRYDGLWWLAADEDTRYLFLEGYLRCRMLHSSPSQRQPDDVDKFKMRKAVDRYYAGDGERVLEPVWKVIEQLIPDPAVAREPLPPDVEGEGEPCCGGDCQDGEYWRQIGGPGVDLIINRSAFIAGLFECLSHFGPEELKFSKTPEYYASKINEFYGVTPEDPEVITDDDVVACTPILEVLRGLADKPK